MQQTDHVILRVSEALRTVTCIDAIVLGGSYATGHNTAHSDIDIGVYYNAYDQLDLNELNRVAQTLDDAHRPNLVTPPGGWGPWVNAGGWIEIDGLPVDLILRDTQRVAQVIKDCESGIISAHYQPGHPHAYLSVMYMGELAESRLLWDATGVVTPLKNRATYYPDALQQALVEMFGFEAQFSSDLASKTVMRNDLYYLTAHLMRSISCLNQLIFAANRRYCLNEKKAVIRANGFGICPDNYAVRIDQLVHDVGTYPSVACDNLRLLVDETLALQMH